jgi:hypothetical protein
MQRNAEKIERKHKRNRLCRSSANLCVSLTPFQTVSMPHLGTISNENPSRLRAFA